MIKLKDKYEFVVGEYIDQFERKQEMYFEYWIGDLVGQLAAFGDYVFSFDDIRYDIDNDIEKRKILQWHNYCLSQEKKINYYSFIKGAR